MATIGVRTLGLPPGVTVSPLPGPPRCALLGGPSRALLATPSSDHLLDGGDPKPDVGEKREDIISPVSPTEERALGVGGIGTRPHDRILLSDMGVVPRRSKLCSWSARLLMSFMATRIASSCFIEGADFTLFSSSTTAKPIVDEADDPGRDAALTASMIEAGSGWVEGARPAPEATLPADMLRDNVLADAAVESVIALVLPADAHRDKSPGACGMPPISGSCGNFAGKEHLNSTPAPGCRCCNTRKGCGRLESGGWMLASWIVLSLRLLKNIAPFEAAAEEC